MRAGIGLGIAGAQFGVSAHRGQEARRAIGIEAGARGNADADAVGLEFLAAREGGERDLRLGERQRAHLRIADHVARDAVEDRGLADLVLADRGMARDHMRHLVRQHRGDFGIVVGERQQSAGDVELAGRQREGVDRGRVQDRDLVMHVRPLRGGDQLFDGAIERALRAPDWHRRRHRRRGCGDARAAAGVLASAFSLGTSGSEIWRPPVRRAGTGRQRRRQRHRPQCLAYDRPDPHPSSFPIGLADRLELRRIRSLDPRAGAFLDEPANPHMLPGQRFRRDPARYKSGLVTFRNRNCEIFGPSAAEIYVDQVPALAHRQDLAFHNRETAKVVQDRAMIDRPYGRRQRPRKRRQGPDPAPVFRKSAARQRMPCHSPGRSPEPVLAPASHTGSGFPSR